MHHHRFEQLIGYLRMLSERQLVDHVRGSEASVPALIQTGAQPDLHLISRWDKTQQWPGQRQTQKQKRPFWNRFGCVNYCKLCRATRMIHHTGFRDHTDSLFLKSGALKSVDLVHFQISVGHRVTNNSLQTIFRRRFLIEMSDRDGGGS